MGVSVFDKGREFNDDLRPMHKREYDELERLCLLLLLLVIMMQVVD